jgi:hypothetical protein
MNCKHDKNSNKCQKHKFQIKWHYYTNYYIILFYIDKTFQIIIINNIIFVNLWKKALTDSLVPAAVTAVHVVIVHGRMARGGHGLSKVLPCSTFLCPVGRPPLKWLYWPFQWWPDLQGRRPVADSYPFGHPTPHAYGCHSLPGWQADYVSLICMRNTHLTLWVFCQGKSSQGKGLTLGSLKWPGLRRDGGITAKPKWSQIQYGCQTIPMFSNVWVLIPRNHFSHIPSNLRFMCSHTSYHLPQLLGHSKCMSHDANFESLRKLVFIFEFHKYWWSTNLRLSSSVPR